MSLAVGLRRKPDGEFEPLAAVRTFPVESGRACTRGNTGFDHTGVARLSGGFDRADESLSTRRGDGEVQKNDAVGIEFFGLSETGGDSVSYRFAGEPEGKRRKAGHAGRFGQLLDA